MTATSPEFSPEVEKWISEAIPEISDNFLSRKIDRRETARVAQKHGILARDDIHEFWCVLAIAAKQYFDLLEIQKNWASGHKNISQREKIRREFNKIISGRREFKNWDFLSGPNADPVLQLLRIAIRAFEADLWKPNSEYANLGFADIDRDEFGIKGISHPVIPKLMEKPEFREFICQLALDFLRPGEKGRKANLAVHEFMRLLIAYSVDQFDFRYQKTHVDMEPLTNLEKFLHDCALLLDPKIWPSIKSILIKKGAADWDASVRSAI